VLNVRLRLSYTEREEHISPILGTKCSLEETLSGASKLKRKSGVKAAISARNSEFSSPSEYVRSLALVTAT